MFARRVVEAFNGIEHDLASSRVPRPIAAGLQLGLLHQTYDTIETTSFTGRPQGMPDARTAIGAVAELEAPDKPCKSAIVLAALSGPTVKLFTDAAVGPHHDPAHRAGRPNATIPSNEAVLQSESFAK